MEPTSERDTQERKTGPTVSKDKWVNHAKNKLARGYALIVGTERKTANFYSSEKGYEMCAFNVARQLIKDGAVRKVRKHHLGDVYELVEMPVRTHPTAQNVQPAPDDDIERLLDELDIDRKGEAEEGTPIA